MVRPRRVSLRYRLGVASRIVAATGGSYAGAALLAVLLALVLPAAPIDRAVTGTLIAIAALPFLALVCFWMRSAGRAWLAMGSVSLLLAGADWLAGWRP